MALSTCGACTSGRENGLGVTISNHSLRPLLYRTIINKGDRHMTTNVKANYDRYLWTNQSETAIGS